MERLQRKTSLVPVLFLHFRTQLGIYDPDYEVPHTQKWKPPHLPQYFEYGILKG